MILAVNEAGEKGLNKSEFEKMFTDELLIIPRIRDLVESGMIFLDQEKYRLALSGRVFISIFIFYRKLMKAQKGG